MQTQDFDESRALEEVKQQKKNISVQDELNNALKGSLATEDKDIKDVAKQVTYVKGASDLQDNEEFKTAYQSILGEQLLQDLKDEGKRQAIINQARKQEANNMRASGFFEGCRPIFDLLNIDKPFGLVPMFITVILLLLPFLIVSFVRFIINSVNAIFLSISKFTKPALFICSTFIIILITLCAILFVLYGIDSMFGTNILNKIGEITK